MHRATRLSIGITSARLGHTAPGVGVQTLISRKICTSSPASASLQLLAGRQLTRPHLLFTPKDSALHIYRPAHRRRLVTNRNRVEDEEGPVISNTDKGSGARRVEVNLSESVDQVAKGYLKKFGGKMAELPGKTLKYGALAALAVGGAGYMAVSAVAQKARSLFGAGREVSSYDPAAAKKKGDGFFARLLKNHMQEALAHEVSRTMSLMTALSAQPRLHQVMGGEAVIDMEHALEPSEYLNPTIAKQHPRFEISTVRTWEYDEHRLVSTSGRQARLVVQSFLDEKEDLERESEAKVEKRRRARERRKLGLPPEEESAEEAKQPEKTYNWTFVHMSVFLNNDSRQVILTHDENIAGKDLILLSDAEWPGDKVRDYDEGEVVEAFEDEDEDDAQPRRRTTHSTQFIDAEVIQPGKKSKRRR